jgi:single-stranded DNA-binding protein
MNGTIYSTIIGTICSDPKPFFKVQGDEEPAGCTFRVAINRNVREGGEWKTVTQFLDITALGFQAKALMKTKWCVKGYHAYFLVDQSERQYNRKDGTIVKVPTFTYMDGHPILVSDSYKQQKRSNEREEVQQAQRDKVAEVGEAPARQQPLRYNPDNMAEDDIPF